MTDKEFFEVYWQYYLLLENEFLATKRYLEIDDFNKTAYSTEYLKQYQTICSEIDVFCKEFCKTIDENFSEDKIQHYCKTIIDYDSCFPSKKLIVKGWEKEICPWASWSYKIQTTKKGVIKIVSDQNPEWWTLYNKVKHQRTTKKDKYDNIPFFKYANQDNVVNALGALFILEMACLDLIISKESRGHIETYEYKYTKSSLFSENSKQSLNAFEKYECI